MDATLHPFISAASNSRYACYSQLFSRHMPTYATCIPSKLLISGGHLVESPVIYCLDTLACYIVLLVRAFSRIISWGEVEAYS